MKYTIHYIVRILFTTYIYMHFDKSILALFPNTIRAPILTVLPLPSRIFILFSSNVDREINIKDAKQSNVDDPRYPRYCTRSARLRNAISRETREKLATIVDSRVHTTVTRRRLLPMLVTFFSACLKLQDRTHTPCVLARQR